MNVALVKSGLCKPKLQEFAEAYEAAKQPYWQNTRPYHSVQSIDWDVREADTVNGRAIAVARSGQTLRWFSFGIGSSINLSGNPTFQATEAETTSTEALKTNNDDFAIQWIAAFARGCKTAFAANPFTDTDPTIIAAMLGQVAITDPFSYRIAPEFGSPALLEMAQYHALAAYIALRLEWDNGSRTEKIGTLDQLTQGGGASYLHANGEPSSESRIHIPEGYGWTRPGQPGSQMQAIGVLTQDIVMPISLPQLPAQGNYLAPTHLYTEIVLRLGGVHFTTPSTN